MKRLGTVIFASLLTPFFACSSSPPPSGGAEETEQLPPSAVGQIEALLAEKAARTPAQRKVASALLYAKSGTFAAASTGKDPATHLTSLLKQDAKGRVMIDIKGDVDAAQVAALGGEVVSTSPAHHATRAWLDVARVDELAALPTVRSAKPAAQANTNVAERPDRKFRVGTHAERVAAMQRALERGPAAKVAAPTTAAFASVGAKVSEGSQAHGVDRARKLYNVDGTGTTVGVLSDSDDGREAAIASGDLPASTVTIPGQDGRPGAGEGTAMMEIVHDLAPGANVVFATAFNGPEAMADNIRRLRFEYHADVIVDDVIYYTESPYQDDIIAQAVEDVVADGAVYVSSAGNEGNQDDGTSGTWEGDFKPAGALATLPSGYTVHNFGDKVISDRVEKAGGPVILQWSDPGTMDAPMSANDYDLFILDHDLRNVVAASTDLQDGAGSPVEFIPYSIPPGYRVVIARHPNAETRAIRALVYRGELGLSTPGSTYGHDSAANALDVAAVDAAEANGGEFTGGPTTPIELFSSDGPRRVFYDRDGNELKPGKVTFASGGGELRNKPDLAGADGVQTTLPADTGLEPFYGTSAAAPHVAAIAALVKSAVPSATPAQIREALKSTALDIEAAGYDRDSGAGLAFAPAALKKIGATPAAYLELNSLTLTPTGSDVLLPGGSAQLRVQLVNHGGAKASAVRATLSSPDPLIHVTSATSTYPNLAAGATGTDPTMFAFSIDPAFPCGGQVPLVLSIDYTGAGTHPATVTLALQTGRPGAPVAYPYAGDAVAIPDGDLAGVDVPLTIAGASAIGQLQFSIDGAACSADAGATTVGIDHTWVGDLTMTLTSPHGTTVALFDRAGGPNNDGNNVCQAYLDDGFPASIQSVTAAQAPFTGGWKPLGALAAFAGEDPNGTWTLHVVDNVLSDAGSVRAFTLSTSSYTCTP